MKVTYLGPAGATFSEMAYVKLASAFGAPFLIDASTERVLARTNEEVISLVIGHGGYGVLAMETRAQGRIDPTVNSFIDLLGQYSENCPLQILGAMRMKLHFALMAREGVALAQVNKIVAHPKAIGACRGNIAKLGVEVIESSSNGKAAEDVAHNSVLKSAAALAPMTAASTYNLITLRNAFEDAEAMTTFFLFGPTNLKPFELRESNRALFIFQVKHVSGSLVKVLKVFERSLINLTYIHSFYTGNGEYDFAIETDLKKTEVDAYERAIESAKKKTGKYLHFGPFPVLTG